MITGIDPFTNRPIFNKSDPPARKLADVMSYLWRMSAPTWLTDIGAANKLIQAMSNEGINKYGEPGPTVNQALARFVGANVYPIDPEATRRQNLVRMDREIIDIKRRRGQRLRDARLSEEERQEIREEFRERIRARSQQKEDYAKASRVPVRLRVNP